MLENIISKKTIPADGVQRQWDIPFTFYKLSDVGFYVSYDNGKTIEKITQNIRYEKDGNYFVYPTEESKLPVLPVGATVLLLRETENKQFATSETFPFNSKDIEHMADNLTMQIQDLKRDSLRSVKSSLFSEETGEEFAERFFEKADEAIESASKAQKSANDAEKSNQESLLNAQNAASSAVLATSASESAREYANSAKNDADRAEEAKVNSEEVLEAAEAFATRSENASEESKKYSEDAKQSVIDAEQFAISAAASAESAKNSADLAEELIKDLDTGVYTKEEIDNKFTVVDTAILGNADAIQKTRSDFMESDSELQQQIDSLEEAIQGGGGGSAEIPDNVYTADNLVGGENISFAKESSYDANTISLYHFEGNSNDEITGAKMLNDSALSGAENKFGTGSLGLIEDTISVGALSKTINPKTTSFTMEFWHKFVAGTTSGRYGEETSIAFMPTEQTNPGWKTNWIGMHMLPDGNYNTIKIQVGESRLGSFDTSVLTTLGAWNHYAFVWDVTTTTFKIYMNGKLGGTYEYGSTDWLETFGYIGAFKYTTGSESLTTARMYIDELRVSDTIRYTGEFEVATKAFEGSEAKTKVNAVLPEGLYTQDSLIAGKNVTFTEVPPEGGIDSHTKALWHFDGDKIDVVNGIEIRGQDTTINTSKSKFGSACLKQPERTYYWTSSSSYCADISSLSLSTENDITVDFWLNLNYRTSSSYAGGAKEFFAFNASSLNFGAFWLWDDANKLIKFGDLQNQTEYSQEISISAYGQWHHVAYVYKAQERKSFIYFDGAKIKESSLPNLPSANLVKFNFWRDNKNYQPENCIDEARISDIVRYDEDFTPPTEPYKVAEGPSRTAVNAIIPEVDIPEGIYTQTNLLGGKDIEIAPEPAVVVAYSYVPYTSGYGYGPFPELLYSSASSIEQGVTTNYYTDIELTDLYGSTSGYTNSSGRLVLRSGSTAKCEMRLLEGTPVEKSTGNYHINFTGQSGKNIGEVYYSQSSLASDNAGALPLFTGETIASANTIYPDFYAWVESHTELQTTAEEYETALTTYGECPKYVISDGSLRLPKLINYIKMANAEDGITQEDAGLPNITGGVQFNGVEGATATGAFTAKSQQLAGAGHNTGASYGFNFDASLSSEVYGKSDTVTPAHTTLYAWVVAYTASIEASVAQTAEFQEGLSGKVDLAAGVTNDNVDYVVESYNDGTNWYRVYKSGWIEQGGRTGVLAADATITVSLIRAMANTIFHTNLTSDNAGGPVAGYVLTGALLKSRTSTNIVVFNDGAALSNVWWEVKGQGA